MRRISVVLFAAACFDPVQETSRPIKEASRAREAAKFAGQYVFGECAPNNQCWRYEIKIDSDGDALVTVVGDPKPLRIKAKPRVTHDLITLSFEAYVDEGVDPSDVGLGVLNPVRGRFSPGQHLVELGRDPTGAWCLSFDSLESKLSSKMLCAAK